MNFSRINLTQSSTLVEEMNLIGDEMTVYPNPCTNFLHILDQLWFEAAFLFIYDVDGKLVYKEIINQSAKNADVSALLSGVYTAILCAGKDRKHGRFLKI